VLWGRKCFGIGHLGPTYSSQHEAQQHQCQENSCRYTRRHEVALQFTSILQLIAATSDVFRDQCSVHLGGHLESPPAPFEHESTQSTSQSLRKRLCQATTPRYANKVITAQGHSWIPNKLHFHQDFVLAAWQKAVGSHHHGQPKVLLPRQDGH